MDNPLDLIIPVNKPVGVSTYDLIRFLKRKTGFTGKIGHGGTLDPFASGVVLLLLGRATKRFEEIRKWDKVYNAGIRLNAVSSTGDITGMITENTDKAPLHVSRTDVENALAAFIGRSEQKIPSYSAAKHEGAAMYKLARQGIHVDKSKMVEIRRIDILSCEYPFLNIKVTCSGGTYIRQLAQDIGTKLGCGGGFLLSLEREKVGDHALSDCCALEDLGTAIR